MTVPRIYPFNSSPTAAKDSRAARFICRLTALGYRAGLWANQSEPGTFAIESTGDLHRVRVHPLPNEQRLPASVV